MPVTDVIFLTHNRLEFTRYALEALIENTDWNLVRHLIAYDDSSVDSTHSYVVGRLAGIPIARTATVNYGSPVAIMNRYVQTLGQDSDFFAKVDNDAIMPPGWLERMLEVMEKCPDLELLGAERFFADPDNFDNFTPCKHIGGIGLIRTEALRSRRLPVPNGRFGWTEWQHEENPIRGWVTPDLEVTLMDRNKEEYWVNLSRKYVEKGWQRPW